MGARFYTDKSQSTDGTESKTGESESATETSPESEIQAKLSQKEAEVQDLTVCHCTRLLAVLS